MGTHDIRVTTPFFDVELPPSGPSKGEPVWKRANKTINLTDRMKFRAPSLPIQHSSPVFATRGLDSKPRRAKLLTDSKDRRWRQVVARDNNVRCGWFRKQPVKLSARIIRREFLGEARCRAIALSCPSQEETNSRGWYNSRIRVTNSRARTKLPKLIYSFIHVGVMTLTHRLFVGMRQKSPQVPTPLNSCARLTSFPKTAASHSGRSASACPRM